MPTRREFIGTAGGAIVIAATTTSLGARVSTQSKQVSMQFIASANAPKALGPYSQAVRTGNTIYTSGQLPLDPATGNLVEGDFGAQARRVFDNLKAVLHEAGADFRNVIKANVYLNDLANFATMNTIYAEYFGDHKPARSTVGVPQLARGAALEIDLVAIL
jgi:2-iminobutanoate/2-iminopropanoate deaminase